ncbi:polysaccharide pyruvyl transferase CsaB [Synechococcus sp. CS-1324]|nr:polysaccharide pyruvyl transferase CsaB [Synechococcus sp. CS-1324]PZV04798.1 MAG: polysaccharide pyruvyl transferase CsaB [Cyanobium sp.]
MARKVLLCGYYGEHNLGDDALLEALLLQLPEGVDPLVTAHDQAEVEQRFGVSTCPRRRLKTVLQALAGCDALVLGGGSLLQDATSFRSLLYYAALIVSAGLQGKPVLLWGQGLGPLQRRSSRWLVSRLLPVARAISWRDPQSAALAAGWGTEAPVGSDPVWSLPPMAWQGSGGAIVLCWRSSSLLKPAGWRLLLAAIDGLAARLDRPVLWLPFHREQDHGLLAELIQQGLLPPSLVARSQEWPVERPEQAMACFARAGLVVAMRLHGLILAALSGAPCAALSYDPKVRVAAQSIGCPCTDLDGIERQWPDAADLAAGWHDAVDRPPQAGRIEKIRQQTQVHRALLQTHLS